MADCLMDLVLRPGETDLPPVQVLLTVVASVGTLAGGDEPGEIDGQVVPPRWSASSLRRLGPQRRARRSPTPAASRAAPAGADAGDRAPTRRRPASWWAADWRTRVLAGLVDRTRPVPDDELDAVGERPRRRRAWLADCEQPDRGSDRGTAPPTRRTRPPRSGPAHRADRPEPPAADRPAARLVRPADRRSTTRAWRCVGPDQALGHARRLVRAAAAADAADEAAWQAGPGRADHRRRRRPPPCCGLTDAQREQLADLLAATGGGGLVDRPRIAVTDALSGALLALTDLPELRRAGTLRPPGRARRDPPAPTT